MFHECLYFELVPKLIDAIIIFILIYHARWQLGD
jgi:hypothetical protein